MSTHTPGPWYFGTEGSDRIQIVACQDKLRPDEASTLIGTANKMVSINCHGESPEAEANARLMAAAPELLEACKMQEGLDPEEITNDELYDFFCTFKDAARAAIDKAEGRNA